MGIVNFKKEIRTDGSESTTLVLWTEEDKEGYFIGIKDFYGKTRKVTIKESKVLDLITNLFDKDCADQ